MNIHAYVQRCEVKVICTIMKFVYDKCSGKQIFGIPIPGEESNHFIPIVVEVDIIELECHCVGFRRTSCSVSGSVREQ